MTTIAEKVKKTKQHYEETPFDFTEISSRLFDKKLTYGVLRDYNFDGKNIVDVGCSVGFVGDYIKKRYPSYNYLGVDINAKAVEIARKKGLDVREGSNLQLDISDGYADFVISDGVIHHTPDPFRCFKELIRITKKDGFIFLYVYNKFNFYYIIYKLCFFIRLLYRSSIGKRIVKYVIFPFFDIFYIQLGNLLFLKKRETIPRDLSWNIFSDQILTPVALFFTKQEIIKFALDNSLSIIKSDLSFMGQGLMFLFQKTK